MKTDDGGQHWQLQSEDKGTLATHVSFSDEQNGWLTGIRYIAMTPLQSVFFVLYTSDQGNHWIDVSNNLNRVANNEEGWITGIISERPSTATVLTLRGQIFRTRDNGQTWQRIGVIGNEPKQTCFCRMGIRKNDHFWVAGGAGGMEGTWGVLAVERDNHSWLRYRLAGAYFTDALVLSDQEVLACGSIPAKSGTDPFNSKRDGVVLYSPDGGRHWVVVYRSSEVSAINALAADGTGDVWAAGDNGLILHLRASEEIKKPRL
jgi:photosystem II stability/assembly factor-like uncharacterized protein